jgi:hypothetical protein
MDIRRKKMWGLSGAAIVVVAVLLAFRWNGSARGDASRTLYGKIVDQMGRPVSGASVEFNSSFIAGFIPFADSNYHRWLVRTTSAPDGKFSINAGKGHLLECYAIAKPGYSKGVFPSGFAFPPNPYPTPLYHPDPGHPVLFVMWNDAFKRILSNKLTISIDGQLYAIRYLSGSVERNTGGSEDLAFTVTYPQAPPTGHFEWRLQIWSGMDGSVTECDGPLAGSAPADGYAPKLEYVMKADDPHWSNAMAKRFYTKERHGNIYAAVELTIQLNPKGGPGTATIEYTASFDHSPDLTPGPVSQFKNDGVAGRH